MSRKKGRFPYQNRTLARKIGKIRKAGFKTAVHALPIEARAYIDDCLGKGKTVNFIVGSLEKEFPNLLEEANGVLETYPSRWAITTYKKKYFGGEAIQAASKLVGDINTQDIIDRLCKTISKLRKDLYGKWNPLIISVTRLKKMVKKLDGYYRSTKNAKVSFMSLLFWEKEVREMCVVIDKMMRDNGMLRSTESYFAKIVLKDNKDDKGQLVSAENGFEYEQLAERIKRMFANGIELVDKKSTRGGASSELS